MKILYLCPDPIGRLPLMPEFNQDPRKHDEPNDVIAASHLEARHLEWADCVVNFGGEIDVLGQLKVSSVAEFRGKWPAFRAAHV